MKSTIARAVERQGASVPQSLSVLQNDGPIELPPDPLTAKAALCDSISAVLGIRILRIIKITGREPSYQLELESTRVEIPTVTGLIDQKLLRRAIASAINRIIPKIRPRDWERISQMLLDALVEREGGVEAEFEGWIRVHVGQYLTETAFVLSLNEQPSHAIRRPTVIDGQIAINTVDLQIFLNKTLGQNLSLKSLASMLSAIGAESIRIRTSKNREQGRWLLPTATFDAAEFTDQANEMQQQRRQDADSE